MVLITNMYHLVCTVYLSKKLFLALYVQSSDSFPPTILPRESGEASRISQKHCLRGRSEKMQPSDKEKVKRAKDKKKETELNKKERQRRKKREKYWLCLGEGDKRIRTKGHAIR